MPRKEPRIVSNRQHTVNKVFAGRSLYGEGSRSGLMHTSNTRRGHGLCIICHWRAAQRLSRMQQKMAHKCMHIVVKFIAGMSLKHDIQDLQNSGCAHTQFKETVMYTAKDTGMHLLLCAPHSYTARHRHASGPGHSLTDTRQRHAFVALRTSSSASCSNKTFRIEREVTTMSSLFQPDRRYTGSPTARILHIEGCKMASLRKFRIDREATAMSSLFQSDGSYIQGQPPWQRSCTLT
eukprot:1156038-Pelagomonas_calceolata.AAC.1